MAYRVFGKTIVVPAVCKIIPKEAKEKYSLTPGAIYTYEKIKNDKIILYEISPTQVKEIKEIENWQQYKILPYQSCILHTIRRMNFIFLEETALEKEGKEVPAFTITVLWENYISSPIIQTKEQYEIQKEVLFNQFRNVIRQDITEFEIIEGVPNWDTPAEFLLPEIIAYRQKQEQGREVVISKVLNTFFIMGGILLFTSSFLEYLKVKKEYTQIAGKFGQVERIKKEVETSKYLERIAERDRTRRVVELTQQAIGKIRQIPQATLTQIEYKIDTNQLLIDVDVPSFPVYKRIKETFTNQAQVNVSYASKITCKIVFNLAGENNETELTLDYSGNAQREIQKY